MDDDEETSYRRRFESVMRDDDAGTTETQGTRQDDAEDNGLLEDQEGGENVWSRGEGPSAARHSTYTEQMLDVLGSDGEDEDVRGYDIEPDVPDNRLPSKSAPELQDVSHDASFDDEVRQKNGLHAGTLFDPNVSAITEDASSVSSLSLKPLRPWQFPAPKRLRMLRQDDSLYSSTANTSQPASPSIASSDEDAKPAGGSLLPYGEPLSYLPKLVATAPQAGNEEDGANAVKPSRQARSFLRLSRLCILNDKEGSPTVMAVASGIIAVGTKQGKVGLFDRSRGWVGAISVNHPVTALAISSDKTYLAIATGNGHILLYDMAKLHAPARHVTPVSLQAVASGRSEGHLQGSPIVHVAFVGTRHTAIVSADENGLSFYHSLGKILGVSSNDTLRILGRYPSDATEESDRRTSILAMATLPLGPQQHQSDTHSFVALLTASKLVLVGLKPSARTWYRRISPTRHEGAGQGTFGCLAWLPCSKVPTPSSATLASGLVLPTLAFTFGRFLYLVRLHTQGQDVVVREWKSCTLDEPAEALRWLSHESLIIYSQQTMLLYDVRKDQCTERQKFVQPIGQKFLSTGSAENGAITAARVSNSVQSHKGQLFVLTANEIVVASLITFADRLLARVSQGDSLGAIQLAATYLQDAHEGGSRIGLPEQFEEQRPIIAQRLIELMRASTAYAFSEDRMKDDLAHYPQGVDRTPFFQSLTQVCAEACLALDDLSFLFNDLYDAYAEAGIESIFADQMESFIIRGQIRTLPIPVVQRLVKFRQRQERYDLAERIIRNVDPTCLDLDQSISLCLEHHLYDALIYVYTSALHDFVGPLIELFPSVKRQDSDAYRVFSYLSIALIGRTYPDQTSLSDPDARLARSSIYSFLFSGRCVLWPNGPGGRLILTMDHQGLDEPTYPYLRFFLNFDAEAFLDALDVAFEDAWLDEEEDWSRQKIVSILYDLDNDGTSSTVQVFVAIFIARNAPKYPQFIRLDAAQVNQLIGSLCTGVTDEDDGDDLKADRQFAVECLLSAYRPAHSESLLRMFEQAGFTDIVRRVYRSEGKWDKLAEMTLSQPTHNAMIFDELDEILRKGTKKNERVKTIVLQALATLVEVDAKEAARLVQRRLRGHLNEAIHILDRSPHRQFAFLSEFVEGSAADQLGSVIRSQFVSLLCSMQPQRVVRCLDAHERTYFDLDHLIEVTRDEDVLDGLLWAQDRSDNTIEGLKEMSEALSERALVLRSGSDSDNEEGQEEYVAARDQVQSLCEMAIRICAERGQESLWVNVLQMLIGLTHDVHEKPEAMVFARGLLQDALSSFVSTTSAEKVSFSSLFTQLAPQKNATYAEVRDISDAMMGAYKLRQELLGITNRLFDRDVFTAMHQLTRKRRRGWRPRAIDVHCPGCGQLCIGEGGNGVRHSGSAQSRGTDDAKELYVNGSLRRSASAGGLDVTQIPLPRSPSFLEPSVSPKPDKGKGVVRDKTDHPVQGDRSMDSAVSSIDADDKRDGATNGTRANGGLSIGGDYFDLQHSDPTDMFLATPSIGLDAMSGTPLPPRRSSSIHTNNVEEHFDPAAAETSFEQQRDEYLQDDGPPVAYDAVIVCFTGEVWHRRCAPARLLQA